MEIDEALTSVARNRLARFATELLALRWAHSSSAPSGIRSYLATWPAIGGCAVSQIPARGPSPRFPAGLDWCRSPSEFCYENA
jgi:hypothetical protein